MYFLHSSTLSQPLKAPFQAESMWHFLPCINRASARSVWTALPCVYKQDTRKEKSPPDCLVTSGLPNMSDSCLTFILKPIISNLTRTSLYGDNFWWWETLNTCCHRNIFMRKPPTQTEVVWSIRAWRMKFQDWINVLGNQTKTWLDLTALHSHLPH